MLRTFAVLVLFWRPSAAHADVIESWLTIADRGPDGRPLPPPLQGQNERVAPPIAALTMFEAVNANDRQVPKLSWLTRR
jgi:hypothetical protein